MPLQGPFVVVADSPAPDVVEALRAAGASPVVETKWADAVAALATVEPEAIVLAQPCSEPERAEYYAQATVRSRRSLPDCATMPQRRFLMRSRFRPAPRRYA
jgi:hypothetical protein